MNYLSREGMVLYCIGNKQGVWGSHPVVLEANYYICFIGEGWEAVALKYW